MENTEFKDKVIGYYTSGQMTLAGKKLEILHAAILAPGVIAVRDSANETDCYFDLNYWQFTYPEIWDSTDPAEATGFRKQMLEARIGVLPGLGRFPAVTDFSSMLEMAKGNLTRSPCWLEEPEMLKV